MLILSREIGEIVRIGQDGAIKIKIVKYNRGQVKVGIDAPKEVDIYREEVFRKINRKRGLNENRWKAKTLPTGEKIS